VYHGTVAQLWRWPVKSLRGELLSTARLDERGLEGDRCYALVDMGGRRDGARFTVRQNAQTLTWSSRYPGRPDGLPELIDPTGRRHRWDEEGLAGLLSESFGAPIALRDQVGQQDRGPTVLVTFEASRAALADEWGEEVDVQRFRPNVHLDVAMPPFAEEGWYDGARLTIGPVALAVVGDRAGPCIRCAVPSWSPDGARRSPDFQKLLIAEHDNKFGVIMRVTAPGPVSIGDPVVATPSW
jgi:uncharacterized protein YcbX